MIQRPASAVGLPPWYGLKSVSSARPPVVAFAILRVFFRIIQNAQLHNYMFRLFFVRNSRFVNQRYLVFRFPLAAKQ